MTQTQHIGLALLVVTIVYALIVLTVYIKRRWTAQQPALAFAANEHRSGPATVETQLLPVASKHHWPWERKPAPDEPEDNAYATQGIPIITTRRFWHQRYTKPLITAALILAIGSGGFVFGYGVGSNHAAKGSVNHAGWLLTSFSVAGTTTPNTNEAVFIFWNIAQTPHNLRADWYVIDPDHAKHTLTADIKVEAASNGQGGITIIDHAATGDITVTGTLAGSTLTLVDPPNSTLFPVAPAAFVTLTFAPSTTDAFNQLTTAGGA